LGGGSVRGFGRALQRITALLGPTSAPTSLYAPSIAGTSVQLSWTNTDNISQIRVYRGATLVTTLSAASTTYTNTGLSSSTSYSFTVRYFKDAIEGSASNAVSPTTLPAEPTSVGSYPPSYESYNNLTVYWTDAINTGASYQVYFNGVLKTTTATNVFSVNIGSLTANTSYSIYVIAVKNGVSSAQSSTISTSTYPCWTSNQLIATYCDASANKIEVRGSGTCGTVYYNNEGNDVALCGYVPAGTLYTNLCINSTTRGATYHDGSGGLYNQAIETCGMLGYPEGQFQGYCCSSYPFVCWAAAGELVWRGCATYNAPPYNWIDYYSDGCAGLNPVEYINDPRCGYSG